MYITNIKQIKTEIQNENKIADHETILIRIKCDKRNQICDKKRVQYFDYKRDSFKMQLENQNITFNAINDIHQKANILENNVKSVIATNIKQKIVNINNSNKWFNNSLRVKKRQKIQAYQKARILNSSESWNDYRYKRNAYKHDINKSKNNYIKNRIQNATTQKQMWREIKTLVVRETKNTISTITHDGIECDNDDENANKMNKYFIESV